MDKIKFKIFKICEYCGEKFFKNYKNKFCWNKRRFCDGKCANYSRSHLLKKEIRNQEIINMYKTGTKQKELGIRFKITRSRVGQIVKTFLHQEEIDRIHNKNKYKTDPVLLYICSKCGRPL